MNDERLTKLEQALGRIYRRPQPAVPWRHGTNLPWDDPAFSERMLREHLDQSHGAASRQRPELLRQVDWLWSHLDLRSGSRVLDITCGPGLYAVELARRGVEVTGIDFSPASIRYGRACAAEQGVDSRCRFVQADVRTALPEHAGQGYDAALFLYGQLAVFTRAEAAALLRGAAAAMRPGGRLAVELLNFERIDKSNSTWWFTDDTGLWGDTPFLHLGERTWDGEQRASIDRFYVIDLQSGELQEIGLSDNGYETEEMLALLTSCGFREAQAYPGWDGLELYDAEEWMTYVGEV
jgi:SAM-dependent methyltransferase